MKKNKLLSSINLPEICKDIMFDIVGSIIFSIGIQSFSSPNNIAPGGVSGISIIINYLTGWQIGTISMLINIPLLILSWFFLGSIFTVRTLKTVVIMSLFLNLGEIYIPPYMGETVISALYSGVFVGIGLAIIFLRGGTTGGSDIISRLLQLKMPNTSMGRMLFAIDAIVLVLSALVYRNIENALYGLIAIFTSARIVDSVLYGLDTGKVVLIISDKYNSIEENLIKELGRGCTRLKAEGSYTKTERPVLMCAIRKNESHALKSFVHKVDENAFVMVVEANEIAGEGFKKLNL